MDELTQLENERYFSELDVRISNNEIDDAIKKLNLNSSSGPDNISGKLLNGGKFILIPLLSLFYNKMFERAEHPKILTMNYLVTILKKGDMWDLDNYRGIAIGSILDKIFSLILFKRLDKQIEDTCPISPNQIGFRKGHRTNDHLFVLNTIVKRFLNVEKKRLYVVFIDFRKAYDKINRNLLMLKLQKRY